MKQDLVESGTAAKDPALLYEIDKLSMDRVQVYPDGELNVQAVASSGTSAVFARTAISGAASSGSPGRSSPAGRWGATGTPGKTTSAAAPGSERYSSGAGHTLTSILPAAAGPPAAATQAMLQAISSMSLAQVQQLEANSTNNAGRYGGAGGARKRS
eukprot:gene4664-4917_t